MEVKTERYNKQKDVARQWRNTEADYISQLAQLLPFPSQVINQLSKPAILRLTAAHMKTKQLEEVMCDSVSTLCKGDHFMDMLGGFLLTVHGSGLILSVSNHVHTILGHHPHDIIGLNITDLLHPDDHKNVCKKLSPNGVSLRRAKVEENGINLHASPGIVGYMLEFVARFRFKVVGKANKVKQTGYTTIHLKGVLKSFETENGEVSCEGTALIAACYPMCVYPSLELSCVEITSIIKVENMDKLVFLDNGFKDIVSKDHKDMSHCRNLRASDFMHPMEVEALPDITESYLERGGVIVTYVMLTCDGRLYQGVSKHSAVFGPKGEVLFSITIESLVSRNRVHIRNWPINQPLIFIRDSVSLPGEKTVSLQGSLVLDEIIDREAGFLPWDSKTTTLPVWKGSSSLTSQSCIESSNSQLSSGTQRSPNLSPSQSTNELVTVRNASLGIHKRDPSMKENIRSVDMRKTHGTSVFGQTGTIFGDMMDTSSQGPLPFKSNAFHKSEDLTYSLHRNILPSKTYSTKVEDCKNGYSNNQIIELDTVMECQGEVPDTINMSYSPSSLDCNINSELDNVDLSLNMFPYSQINSNSEFQEIDTLEHVLAGENLKESDLFDCSFEGKMSDNNRSYENTQVLESDSLVHIADCNLSHNICSVPQTKLDPSFICNSCVLSAVPHSVTENCYNMLSTSDLENHLSEDTLELLTNHTSYPLLPQR